MKAPESINKTLSQWAKESNLVSSIISQEFHDCIDMAFSENESERYTYSIKLLKQIWPTEHILCPIFDLLADFEHNRKFYVNYRDHITHMLKVFFLGAYYYEKIDFVQQLFSDYSVDEFLKTWIITALYHDVGYVVETDENNRDGENFKLLKESINTKLHNPLCNLYPDLFYASLENTIISGNRHYRPEITNMGNIDHDDLIWGELLEAGSKTNICVKKDNCNALKNYYNYMSQPHKVRSYIDHGIFSALLLIYINRETCACINCNQNSNVAEMYMNDDQKEAIIEFIDKEGLYNNYIHTAAEAIAVHNISSGFDEGITEDLLSDGVKIKEFCIIAEKMPYAYLLKVCDEIQCWDRQKFHVLSEEESKAFVDAKDIIIDIDTKRSKLYLPQDEINRIDSALNGITKPVYSEWISLSCIYDFHRSKVVKKSNAILSNGVKKRSDKPPIWLPDAEYAIGEQTRFNNYTSTDAVRSVIRSDSQYWGIASVKGIGKTFVLQIKRVHSSKECFCIPIVSEPGPSNNWATETFVLDDINRFYNIDFSGIVLLWKYAIVCRIINSILYYMSHNSMDQLYNEAIKYIDKIKDLDPYTRNYITDNAYNNVGRIINNTIMQNGWIDYIVESYTKISTVCSYLSSVILNTTQKNAIVIFLDKLDQALIQPTCEPALEDCNKCNKQHGVEECNNPLKSDEYCKSNGPNRCYEKKMKCCYGCEKFNSNYSDSRMRVYELLNDTKLSHINYWNYLQLSLVDAVYQIKSEYSGQIRVYYTIRQEALDCGENILHEQKKKFSNLLKSLWYTRSEQEKIFYDCISFESSKYLFSSSAKKANRLDYAFVGVESLCHPYVKGAKETLFDSIYRHSFDRTRDIQEYGKALSSIVKELKNIEEERLREEKVKKTIEKTAAILMIGDENTSNSLNESYYSEKMDIMPRYWADKDHFISFIMMIDRNLLFSDEIIRICKTVNNCDQCNSNSCKCKEIGCIHHPFSMLYRLGLLGLLTINENNDDDEEQNFLHAKKITYFHEKDELCLDDKTCYIIHPALTKGIELINRGNIKHFNGFILGKGLLVSKEKIRKLFADKAELSKNNFDSLYYN